MRVNNEGETYLPTMRHRRRHRGVHGGCLRSCEASLSLSPFTGSWRRSRIRLRRAHKSHTLPSQGLRFHSLAHYCPHSRPTPAAPLLLRRAQPRSRSCSCRDANGGARANVVRRQSFRGLRRSRRTMSRVRQCPSLFPLDASPRRIFLARRGRREPRVARS